MSEPMVERTAPERMSTPPAIRLVHAFKEAVESSQPAGNPSDEAFAVESLLIAANASFAALSRFADLWHDGTYGELPSDEAGEEQTIRDGCEAWIDAADTLFMRLCFLKRTGYESKGAEQFAADHDKARDIRMDALSRREIERKALRADQLADLAARLEPRQASYDDEGTPP